MLSSQGPSGWRSADCRSFVGSGGKRTRAAALRSSRGQLSSAELEAGGGNYVTGRGTLGSHEDTIADDVARRNPVVMTMLRGLGGGGWRGEGKSGGWAGDEAEYNGKATSRSVGDDASNSSLDFWGVPSEPGTPPNAPTTYGRSAAVARPLAT